MYSTPISGFQPQSVPNSPMDARKLCDGFVFVRMLIGEDIVLKIPLIWSGVIVCDGRNLGGLRKVALGVVVGRIGNGVGDGG